MRTLGEQSHCVRGRRVLAEHDDPGLGMRRSQRGGDADAFVGAGRRHADVGDDDIGPLGLDRGEQRVEVLASGRNLQVQPVSQIKERFQSRSALLVTILSVVIALLLFITSLGIVGLTVFSVAERTRQIGTRRALGAQRGDILRYFLLENWIVTTLGLALGIALAFGLNVALVSRVSGPKMEPGLVAGGVLLLWIAGLAATFLPALRGARVAPAIATRNV